MANLVRAVINWTGGIGLPGFTNLHFRNQTPGVISQAVVDDAVTKLDAFLTGIRGSIPSTVTLAVNATLTEIDETDGTIQAFWTGTPAAAGAGTGGSIYAAPSGGVVNWTTSAVRNGRLIRGRSFLVPMDNAAYDTGGTIATTDLTALNTAATNLRAASGDARLVVWGRPTTAGGTDGVSAEVTSSNVPDKVAILSSRRD